MRAGYCRFEHADQIRFFLRRSPGSFRWFTIKGSEAAMTAGKSAKKDGAAAGSPAVAGPVGGEGAEVAEERVEVVTYAAAIDVAKGSGMVCTRVPGSRPDRKRQAVWQVDATYADVVALMDHLRCEGIQRLVLESTSDYWRTWYYLAEAAGLEVWLVNAREAKHLPGRGKSDPLTELPGEVPRVCGRMGGLVATVADHDHRRRCAAGSVPAGDAVGRVA